MGQPEMDMSFKQENKASVGNKWNHAQKAPFTFCLPGSRYVFCHMHVDFFYQGF